MQTEQPKRRLPIGAEVQSHGGAHFRVWAPKRKRVAVVLETGSAAAARTGGGATELTREPGGYFSGLVAQAAAGSRYRFRLDDEAKLYPDPASRYQPEGVHGPSEVVDPNRYAWRDQAWRGVQLAGQIIYELHVGTFTEEGTWSAATARLADLAELGVTLVEVMPVNEFPGRFGWGYDGVDLFAPTRAYGAPDDFRAFVDEAHRLGLGVLLDAVYNHFGPSGNYLRAFTDDFMVSARANEWGESLNFDGENSGPVREFFIANAGYWIDEYHLDGLRLDATYAIHDRSSPHLLQEILRQVRAAAGGRDTLVFSENERQEAVEIRPESARGYGLDGAWNDDFHHSAMVALTGHREFYYSDFRGTPQELISAVKRGYLFQGQHSAFQRRPRGTPALGIPAARFVVFLQNHDQVANSALGRRVHLLTSPGNFRALTALMLLAPGTPLLFQGQEFCASSPFLYFADHEPDLARAVRKGRFEFLKRFGRAASEEMAQLFSDPESIETFQRSKLDWRERASHREAWALHRDLIRLRRDDSVFRVQNAHHMHGSVLSDEALVLRYFGQDGDDRLVLVNLGSDLHLNPAPEPLLAPPESRRWRTIWSSEHPSYGGHGTPPVETDDNWRIPAQATVVLGPRE